MATNLFNFGPVLDQVLADVQSLLVNLTKQGVTMAEDFTALNAAVAALKEEVMAIGSEMDTLLADLNAALAAGNQPAIDAATSAIQAQVDALKAAGTRDMPPPSPPMP